MASDSESREGVVENICEMCPQKELGVVYTGQSCLLLAEHISELDEVKPLPEKQ